MATWRLQLAAQNLRHTQESIARIADRSGYGSEEAFSRAFKRFSGSSPGAWRESTH
jgi:AraC-like DNA-binding protein